MIHINSNDPEHMKARQNVKPLTMEEEKDLVDEINTMINLSLSNRDWVPGVDTDNIQRLIYRYENLKNFFEIVGGWEAIQNYKAKIFDLEVALLIAEKKAAGETVSNDVSLENDDAESLYKAHIIQQINEASEWRGLDEIRASRETQIKNVSQAIDDVENYDKVHFTHEVNLQTGEEKIVDLGNWIDVDDRLPKNPYKGDPPKEYLVTETFTDYEGKINTYTTTSYFSKGVWYKYIDEDYVPYPKHIIISHWQPLPEPPKTIKFNIPKP